MSRYSFPAQHPGLTVIIGWDNPLVTFFQRGLRYRGLAVAAVYIGFFGFLGLAGYLAANPIADQARSFQRDVPGIIDSANENLADLQEWLDDIDQPLTPAIARRLRPRLLPRFRL